MKVRGRIYDGCADNRPRRPYMLRLLLLLLQLFFFVKAEQK